MDGTSAKVVPIASDAMRSYTRRGAGEETERLMSTENNTVYKARYRDGTSAKVVLIAEGPMRS